MYHRTYIRRWFCCCWCVFCVNSTASSPRRYITACALAIDLNIGLCARTSIQIHKQHQHTPHSENAKSVFTYYMQTLLHWWIECAAAIWNSSSIYGNFRYAFCVLWRLRCFCFSIRDVQIPPKTGISNLYDVPLVTYIDKASSFFVPFGLYRFMHLYIICFRYAVGQFSCALLNYTTDLWAHIRKKRTSTVLKLVFLYARIVWNEKRVSGVKMLTCKHMRLCMNTSTQTPTHAHKHTYTETKHKRTGMHT